jgi:HEPN domain-containing protein/predicted nucleotidyltransferase
MTREPAAIARRVQEALETAKLSFALAGAVLFGSSATARAAAHSDVDLLVVGRGLPLKRQRRCREIVEIKQWLPGVPLDVLLLTPEEVESNFRNHNPLFLNIAEDGVVLLDREGTLARAIEATRRYVRERGIVRTDQGWRFPVEVGMPTLLSRVSNRDFAWGMLRDAERDRRIGERLLEDGFYDKAVYHFQQAVEKAVKAALIGLGIFQKTHLVGAVLREVTLEEKRVPAQWKDPLLEAARLSEELEPEVSLSRYPGIIDDALWLPSEEYGRDDAEAAGAKATKALAVAGGFVKDWFAESPPSEG